MEGGRCWRTESGYGGQEVLENSQDRINRIHCGCKKEGTALIASISEYHTEGVLEMTDHLERTMTLIGSQRVACGCLPG